MYVTPCSLFIFYFFILFNFFVTFLFLLLYCFAPLFAKLHFAVFPDVFPCIIYEKKKIKRKKKTFGLFFTVVSLLYNNTVRIFLEF